ncbi:carbamoyltransferase family protein [Tateyamaria omphalii]|uniref:Nodulation protein n=1 Tax=Tateyamaria omphalii TaxID=299262 RepID=A0A1P8N1X0_9RHOB|nr:carbamoyltransferase N-terminal domain-containing protein [Tateyamaria omphalii]APX14307.1 nodulation protein [Tateyamaria omphalii]
MSNSPRVLGISSHFHDAAAALVQGDQILAAAQEERFSRKKGDWRFPTKAIEYCISQLPAGAQLDKIAYYEDPGLKASRMLETARRVAPGGAQMWPNMLRTLRALTHELPQALRDVAPSPNDILFVPHHRSHASAAFHPSPFDAAAVLVLDGVGEWSTTSIWHGQSKGLTALTEITFPHSLGLFYSAFTQFCGFKVNSGEYKLMGLAPFGAPNMRKLILDHLIDLRDDGSFALNMEYFGFDRSLSTTSPLFETLFKQPQRAPDAPVTAFHMNVAASAQAVLEEAVLRLARTALQKTGERNLCMAGGVALNCVANSNLLHKLPSLDSLWIQPASGDAGGALGAALDVAHRMAPLPRRIKCDRMSGSLLGPEFNAGEIQSALDSAGLSYRHEPDPERNANDLAAALADRMIVGHFHGRMEYGPRALGNRSILADPRGIKTLNRVNRSIKFREDWRPFAPIVLADRAADYFEPPHHSPYMLLVAKLLEEHRGPVNLRTARARGAADPMALQTAVTSDVPAVTHVDFSARLQTIDPDTAAQNGSRASAILRAFEAQTGCPMLLNTSFNVRGEPIVCTPRDAINCFLNTHMDVLAIGDFLVRKTDQPGWVEHAVGRRRFDPD